MAKKKSPAATLTALEVLAAPDKHRLAPVTVLAGNDDYLRHEVRRTLVAASASPDGDEPPFIETLDGRRAELHDLLDALAERSLFGDGRRIVVVEDAEALVKRYRPQLEDYCDRPTADSVLALEVPSWPGNTRLAKRVAEMGLTVQCLVPTQGRELTSFQRQLKDWLVAIARREYETELERPAVDLLLEKLPSEPGLVYQEVAKLSLISGASRRVDAALVRAARRRMAAASAPGT